MILLLGSNNKHKASEINQIIEFALPNKFEIKILSDVLDNDYDVVEDGKTLEENAFKKAFEYFQLTGLPCFADDTGLEIDYLNGLPGVNSARFAGKHGNDAENRKKVLFLLEKIEKVLRTAHFRTVICFYDGNNAEYFEGVCEGLIIRDERGTNGFGYDSIFIPNGFDMTFAQMNADEKNTISHRGKAINKFVTFLKYLK